MSYGKNFAIGTLFWNFDMNMLDAILLNGRQLGGIELGKSFDILINGYWVNTHLIERNDELYLANIGRAYNSYLGSVIRITV